LAIFIIIDSL